MAWNPNTYRPLIRRQGDPTYMPMWEGAILTRAFVDPATAIRVGADATRVLYNPYGGRKIIRLTYAFRRMPIFFRNQLDTLWNLNKDTWTTKGQPLEIWTKLVEDGPSSGTTYVVDIADTVLNAQPEFGARKQPLGFTGSMTFESHAGKLT